MLLPLFELSEIFQLATNTVMKQLPCLSNAKLTSTRSWLQLRLPPLECSACPEQKSWLFVYRQIFNKNKNPHGIWEIPSSAEANSGKEHLLPSTPRGFLTRVLVILTQVVIYLCR